MSSVKRPYFSSVHRATCFLVNAIVGQASKDRLIMEPALNKLQRGIYQDASESEFKLYSRLLKKHYKRQKALGRYGQSKHLLAACMKIEGSKSAMELIVSNAKIKYPTDTGFNAFITRLFSKVNRGKANRK